jgi:hypothetical protein
MATSPPPPIAPKRPRRFSTGLLTGLLIAVLVAAAAFGVISLRSDTGSKVAAPPSQSPPPSPNSSPSPSRQPKRTRPQVIGKFSAFLQPPRGERLSLIVIPVTKGECQLHLYKPRGAKPIGAFDSDCASWENSGVDILLFNVSLSNHTDRALSFSRRDFVLASRDGRTFGPVDVRSQATQPPNFLPDTGKILPQSSVRGWLTFDGRVTGLVPDSLSYVDGDQTLTLVFDGKPSVR